MTISQILAAHGFRLCIGGSYVLDLTRGGNRPRTVRLYTRAHEGGDDLTTLTSLAPTLRTALLDAQEFCDLLDIPGVARGYDKPHVTKSVRPSKLPPA